MTRKLRSRKVDAGAYRIYRIKSAKFFRSAAVSMDEKNYEAAALACIHCVISGVDAYLGFRTGERSASDNHMDAIFLFRQSATTDAARSAAKHAERVLQEKTSVEYLDVLVTDKQALDMFKHTARFIEWLDVSVPK